RLPAPAAADDRRHLTPDRGGVEPFLRQRLVEVDDEERPPVDRRAEQDGECLLAVLQPVGEVAERAAAQRLRLGDDDAAVLPAYDHVRLRRGLGRTLPILLGALELGPQLVRLVRSPLQESPGYSGRDRLDPPDRK